MRFIQSNVQTERKRTRHSCFQSSDTVLWNSHVQLGLSVFISVTIVRCMDVHVTIISAILDALNVDWIISPMVALNYGRNSQNVRISRKLVWFTKNNVTFSKIY